MRNYIQLNKNLRFLEKPIFITYDAFIRFLRYSFLKHMKTDMNYDHLKVNEPSHVTYNLI